MRYAILLIGLFVCNAVSTDAFEKVDYNCVADCTAKVLHIVTVIQAAYTITICISNGSWSQNRRSTKNLENPEDTINS